ncbi:MAG: Crp/Fnr family transcriptional regulator [Cyclobacteriaceae bacterium]|nr:Crp/Fnr family transcriptional regulator [Cyclobacteriaceae bacterium]
MRELVEKHFPFFKEPELVDAIVNVGKEIIVKEGEPIIKIGEFIKSTPLITEGLLKVIRQDESGNEILLYYLEGGNTCVMTVTCCMHQEKSKIKAIAEKDSHLILIPFHYMDDWMRNFRTWRNFILQTYSSRFEEMLSTLDATAFESLDNRLIKYLNDKQTVMGTDEFRVTHQQIASELNSSREAVSRLLKKLEILKAIQLGRNKIKILKELH